MLSCIVIAVVLSAGLGVLLLRTLMRALGAEPDILSEVTQRVASGDLSPVPGAHQAPAGSVLASMGEMQGSLVKLIGQVRMPLKALQAGRARSRRATWICPRAPKSKRHRWKKRQPAWKS
jgi:methyl-accepting chemotaxis protein-1 (serine sensor receptor)